MAQVPVVDKDLCTSCGLCTEIASNTFRLDKDDIAECFNPAGDPQDVIVEAIESCPVEAISWKEA
ncbi:MAG: ferredoxin [Nitrospirae bacterium]|nr:ferredoxin [Nitrospirota bacterium]